MFGRKKQRDKPRGAVAQTVPRPFGASDLLIPARAAVMTRAERELYASLRESVPVIDAALGKIVRLVGSFHIISDSRRCQEEAERFVRGVRVNAVAPGFIDTEMTKVLPEEQRKLYEESIPLKRLGTAEDVAQAVAFLASPKASYITGHVLAVNGGMYC